MLIKTKLPVMGGGTAARQRGLVLVVVLIVLTAMMFAGIALMNSVNTATLVAGNMAYRQAATHQGDFGTEAAVVWLQTNNTGTILQNDATSKGYYAEIRDPITDSTAANRNWDYYWNNTLDTSPPTRPITTVGGVNSNNVWTLQTTLSGYTVSYVIHRMCPKAATNAGCVQDPIGLTATGNSNKAGNTANFTQSTQIYYRITSRIEGPRNTVSYTQAVVSM